jgi:hypothetical protein
MARFDHCPNCGREMPSGNLHCFGCGVDLAPPRPDSGWGDERVGVELAVVMGDVKASLRGTLMVTFRQGGRA